MAHGERQRLVRWDNVSCWIVGVQQTEEKWYGGRKRPRRCRCWLWIRQHGIPRYPFDGIDTFFEVVVCFCKAKGGGGRSYRIGLLRPVLLSAWAGWIPSTRKAFSLQQGRHLNATNTRKGGWRCRTYTATCERAMNHIAPLGGYTAREGKHKDSQMGTDLSAYRLAIFATSRCGLVS